VVRREEDDSATVVPSEPALQPDPDWPFSEEGDGTVWFVRPDAQPVKVLDRELREGEALGRDEDGLVWLTTPDLRVIRLMRVGDDGPPTEVTLVLNPDDRRVALLEEEGIEAVEHPPALAPDPPGIETWDDHPDRDLLRGLGTPGRPGSDGRPVTLGEVLATPDPEWLVERVLIESELAVLYGRPKAGKTFAAIDLALSVATGRDFHGRGVGRPRPVIYVIAEGNAKLFALRCRAWLAKRGIDRPPATFRMVPARVAMTDPRAVRALIDRIGHPALVVIDTLTRTLSGDENSPADMAKFVSGCDDVREATGSAVCVVHHEGKSQAKGPMGHTRLLAAVDTSIHMQMEPSGIIKLKIEDQRNGPGDLEMAFRIGDGPCLVAVATRRDETDAEFADFQDDATADRRTRVRRLAATMVDRQKGDVIAAVAAMLRVSDKPARDALAEAVPTGFDHAAELDGMRLWLERLSGRSTVMRSEPVEG
jgi:hypothetical protein